MVNLEHLNLADCCEQIPNDSNFFKDLNNLRYLNIAGNTWNNPSKTALFPMKRLQHLDISRTSASIDVAVFFVKQKNLEVVLLNSLHEKALNVSEINFSSNKLWKLSLSGNKLSGFCATSNPFGLKSPYNLQFLDLSNTNITLEKVRNFHFRYSEIQRFLIDTLKKKR